MIFVLSENNNHQQQLLLEKMAIQHYTTKFEEYKDRLKVQISSYHKLYKKYQNKYVDENNDHYHLPTIKVVNMVVSTFVEDGIIASKIDELKNDLNTEYYPNQFPGYVFRMHNPKCTMLLFQTGKVIVTGTKELDDAKRGLDGLSKRFGIPPEKINEVKIENLVMSVDFRYYIDLEEVPNYLPRAIYEPEQFPGVIYRNVEPKAVFLMFTTGKSNCVGTSNVDNAFEAAFQIRNMLIKHNLLVEKESQQP